EAKKGFLVGRALDAVTHAPLAGARVFVSTRGRVLGNLDSWTTGEKPVTTDASGAFSVELVAPFTTTRRFKIKVPQPLDQVGLVVVAAGHEAFVRSFEKPAFEQPLELWLE